MGLRIDWNKIEDDSYLRDIEALKGIDELKFHSPITFFVGENGSGKSTLLEAIAVAYGFSADGGTVNYNFSTYDSHSELCDATRLIRSCRKAQWGYFLRAESSYNVASAEEEYTTPRGYGLYFRKWLEAEELIPENWLPEDGELRFYANSKQRTFATAHYFSCGFLPAADVVIEHHGEFGSMDDTFNPVIHFYSEAYADAVAEQFEEYGGAEIAADISENADMLCDLIEYTDSEGYKSGELTDLVMNDTGLTIEQGKEPTVSGSLKTASTLSDAFVLQYYEEPDAKKAAFGKDMTHEMWQRTADITTKFNLVRHGLPLISVNVANPIIKEIRSEFTNTDRKFTFLCGHDCTINGVLVSMDVEDYELPYTLEKRTPIGGKLVFEKWEDKDGGEFASVELIYQSTEQLRNITMLGLDTPPAIYSLSFTGLEKNADGLYTYSDIVGRLDKALSDYDDLTVKYADALDSAA